MRQPSFTFAVSPLLLVAKKKKNDLLWLFFNSNFLPLSSEA